MVAMPPPPGTEERERWVSDLKHRWPIQERDARALADLVPNGLGANVPPEVRRSSEVEFISAVIDRETAAYLRGLDEASDFYDSRAIRARSIALYAVICAVLLMPIIAIVVNLDPNSFGTYIAPITGIAGTVVGFWFSSVNGAGSGSRG